MDALRIFPLKHRQPVNAHLQLIQALKPVSRLRLDRDIRIALLQPAVHPCNVLDRIQQRIKQRRSGTAHKIMILCVVLSSSMSLHRNGHRRIINRAFDHSGLTLSALRCLALLTSVDPLLFVFSESACALWLSTYFTGLTFCAGACPAATPMPCSVAASCCAVCISPLFCASAMAI